MLYLVTGLPMSNANRPNRKASDEDIVRLNSLGYSLGHIARELNVHPTTVTLRLQSLDIPPADTRHAFMEEILKSLPQSQIDWLVSQLGPHLSIKDYVKSLLVEKFITQTA